MIKPLQKCGNYVKEGTAHPHAGRARAQKGDARRMGYFSGSRRRSRVRLAVILRREKMTFSNKTGFCDMGGAVCLI